MSNPISDQMRLWEERFKRQTQFVDRSQYKIYYCPIRPAPILALGKNPGGKPENIAPDGVGSLVDDHRNAASTGYYEKDEHDLLDCQWPENKVVELLTPLVGGSLQTIRGAVVKTNMAFRRSPKAKQIDMQKDMDEAATILAEIIDLVNPRLVLLAGVAIADFTSRYCDECFQLDERLVHPKIGQTLFWPWSVRRKGQKEQILAVQVAHASQWGWTYGKYAIADKIKGILKERSITLRG